MSRTGLLPWLKASFYPKYKFNKQWSAGAPTGNRHRGARNQGNRLDQAMIRRIYGGPGRDSPEAKKLFAWLADHHLTPVKAQLPVRLGNVFTRIDLVCTDAQGRHVVFELKTGFRGYYEYSSGGHMKPPFERLTDSVHNQHQLQLLYGIRFMRATHPEMEIHVPSCAVLVVNEDVHVYTLEHPV